MRLSLPDSQYTIKGTTASVHKCPVGIHPIIGHRPIACFGNSDGDKAMMEYTTIKNLRTSLGLIVHHTDAERAYA